MRCRTTGVWGRGAPGRPMRRGFSKPVTCDLDGGWRRDHELPTGELQEEPSIQVGQSCVRETKGSQRGGAQ